MLISSIFDYIYKIIIKQILKKSIICPIFSILIWKDMYSIHKQQAGNRQMAFHRRSIPLIEEGV